MHVIHGDMKQKTDSIKQTRNPLMRDVFRTAGLFAKYIQTHPRFMVSEFTAYAKEHGLTDSRVRSHVSCLIKGFKFAGMVEKTNQYKQVASNIPASPYWEVTKGIIHEN